MVEVLDTALHHVCLISLPKFIFPCRFLKLNMKPILDSTIDCFAEAGYYGFLNFESKTELLAELCHFFVIDKARSALKQFKEGLQTLDIFSSVKQFHTLFRPYFCYRPNTLTEACVVAIFTPVLSEEGYRI